MARPPIDGDSGRRTGGRVITEQARRAAFGRRGDAPEAPSGGPWRALNDPHGPQPLRLPTTPFGRLGVAHAVTTAGDAMVTLSLAGSLFFSVSVDAAVSKVLLYLVLSLAPFAVVAPLIGPWIDRFAGGRRWVVIGTCVARAGVAFVMAGFLDSLLLFPLAFTMLVLSKTYAVARASLVPEVVRTDDQLVTANARLSLIAGLAALVGQIPALAVRQLGGEDWVLRLAVVTFLVATAAAMRIRTVPEVAVAAHAGREAVRARSATLESTAAVRVAVTVMSILRAQVGLLLFLVLFSFRRDGVPTAWYAAVGVAAAASTAIGAALSPRLRTMAGEDVILAAIPALGGAAALMCAVNSSPMSTAVVAAAIGLANAAGRVAFDAVLQRDLPTDARSAAFGRVETIFQLAWVGGALLPVAVALPRWLGAVVVAASSVAAVVIGVVGEPALVWISERMRRLRPDWWQFSWRRPIRADADDGDDPAGVDATRVGDDRGRSQPGTDGARFPSRQARDR